MCFFLSKLGEFNNQYADLFSGTVGEVSERFAAYVKTYGWFINLDIMSNGRRELWDYFTDMNVVQMMNHLAYMVTKMKIENGAK
jgi:hypothetical protein